MLLLVQLAQRVEDEVGVAEGLYADGELVGGLLEVERAGGDLDDEAEGQSALRRAALRVNDAPVVEEHAPLPLHALDRERAGQARVLDDLHGVEDADRGEVAREGDGAALDRRGRR